jgi:hypothetical protein
VPDADGRTYREKPATASGPGRVLIAVYGIFALSATARGLVQIATKLAEAPLAYVLSAVAGIVYILATIGLARRGAGARKLAWTAVCIELAGVLAVGTFSVLAPADFPHDTVWSVFGRDYGFVPLVLPFIGLWWLSRTRAS